MGLILIPPPRRSSHDVGKQCDGLCEAEVQCWSGEGVGRWPGGCAVSALEGGCSERRCSQDFWAPGLGSPGLTALGEGRWSCKEKQAGGASRERHPLGLGYCVKDSTSRHLPGVPAPPSFPALPAHLAGLLVGPRSRAKQDGAFPGNVLHRLQLSSSEVRADSTLSSSDDLAQ